ncbi:MAG: methyltransferase domain-containing protein [Rhodobacteraceae bacterium]|nr:methyltransferase domain-containing protein [Paracoccaceae bacterium]
MADHTDNWNPGTYAKFRDLRLRPALDLLAQVPELPDGDVIDLGCGNGPVGAALKTRFAGRRLIGVDSSSNMLEAADQTGMYDDLQLQDIATWNPDTAPALIFSNAALHWLPDHDILLPGLVRLLALNGVLAVQMPRQFEAPSHVLLRQCATDLWPDRFDWHSYAPPVLPPEKLVNILSPMGKPDIWEASYVQVLDAAGQGHPVRRFTISTAAQPILAKLSKAEQVEFLMHYDTALTMAYPVLDGKVIFPFLRQFCILRKKG